VRLAEPPPPGAGIAYDSQDIPGLALTVVPAQALGWKKCDRCWTWSAGVGVDARHPALCGRCLPVVLARS
jgi:isoleucyl-tRNA synthetase